MWFKRLSEFDKLVYELVLALVFLGFVSIISAVVAYSDGPLPERLQISYVSQAIVPAFYIWGLAGAIWVVDTLFLVRRRLRTSSPVETVKQR